MLLLELNVKVSYKNDKMYPKHKVAYVNSVMASQKFVMCKISSVGDNLVIKGQI